ncbi:hypothetical protein DYB26_009541 [Aphanomyces astaci]|uniref:Uncharacterized protein n=1 Tax=Aphanomyces astaci TaxID=112090 RepID=A0A3R6ZF70_APHAT|nr:hypothetical protein DYB26_009541 [Aphanomyces astaci]
MQRQWLQWKNRVLYAANKFQYDAQKKAELLWYGSNNVGSAHANVSVPFMVTRQMKVQLADKGFPSHIVAALTPANAHAILQSNTSFDAYLKDATTSSTPNAADNAVDTTTLSSLAATRSSESPSTVSLQPKSPALTCVPTTEDSVGKTRSTASTAPVAALAIVLDKPAA